MVAPPGVFVINFPPGTYVYPTLGIPVWTTFSPDVPLGFIEFLNLDGSADLFIFDALDFPFTFTNTAGHF